MSDLLRRAAVGGAALAFPGALAAWAPRPPGPTEQAAWQDLRLLELAVLHRTSRRTATPRSTEFAKKYGVKVEYVRGHQRQLEFWAKIEARSGAAQSIERDMIVMTDNSR